MTGLSSGGVGGSQATLIDEELREPPRGRKRRRRLLVLLVVLLALTILAGAAAASAYSAYRDLDEARTAVVRAERQLREAELSDARNSLDVAVDHAAAASRSLRRPWVVPGRWLPLVGPNLRAATVLSDTARDNGTAAAELLEVATVIVSDERDQAAGEISLDYLEELAPPTRLLADTLVRTTEEVEQLSTGSLLEPVRRARQQYLDLALPNLDQAVVMADLLEVMPRFLGADEPRTYLVAAGALSENRASGGLLGSWSLLRIDAGVMSFEEFVDVDRLPAPDEPVAAPSAEYEARYGRFDALRQYRNANMTPHFPSAARVIGQLWERGGGAPVDGVILADPVAYAMLAERSDGLELPGLGELSAAETLRFVGIDAYDAFEDDDERKRVLGLAATAAFAEMFEILEDDDVPATVEMLAALVAGGNLRMYAEDELVQEVFVRAGAAGDLPGSSGESAGIFTNNIAGNKVDWFETRAIEHRVQMLPGGVTEATIEASFQNGAPSDGHRRGVLGPWTSLTEAGDNLLLTTFTCSTTCDVIGPAAGSQDGGREQGRPMFDQTLLVPSGQTTQMQFRTRSEDAWAFEGDELVVDVQHLVQSTLHGVHLVVRIPIPAATQPLRLPEGAEVRDGEVVWRDQASGRIDLRFVFDASRLEVGG